MRIARFWRELDNSIECLLCPRHCHLSEGQTGTCLARKVLDSQLMSLTYGQTVSIALDPVEKKPFYHFFPGRNILSLGPNACNLHCVFCQNWQISQVINPTRTVDVELLIQQALDNQSVGIAFTYAEPLMWAEFILDCAPRLREKGLKIAMVSNGYAQESAMQEISHWVDAWNIDLKGFSEEFYRKYTTATLAPVLKSLEIAAQSSWLEITNLVIPGWNDDLTMIRAMCRWIAELNPRIPLHFSRYYPNYRAHQPATSEKLLMNCYEIAKEYLSYVYLGNIAIRGKSDTVCSNCGNMLVQRLGYQTNILGLTAIAQCAQCGTDHAFILS